MKSGPKPKSIKERIQLFWSRVNFLGPIPLHHPDLGPCWIWTGSTWGGGYGQVRMQSGRGVSPVYAHRVSYELFFEKIPKGLELDHLCRVINCVNPKHLEAVTHRVNMLRGETLAAKNVAKTHCPKGHEYSPDNTHICRRNIRHCRICDKEAHARRKNLA